jgi:hypothetical protein
VVPPEEVKRRLEFADAALGAAGQVVSSDLYLDELDRMVAAELITVEDANARTVRYLTTRRDA